MSRIHRRTPVTRVMVVPRREVRLGEKPVSTITTTGEAEATRINADLLRASKEALELLESLPSSSRLRSRQLCDQLRTIIKQAEGR